MSADLSLLEAAVEGYRSQLEALGDKRDELLRRVSEELASSHVYARSMNGWRFTWDVVPTENLVADLSAVCRLHDAVHVKWTDAVKARDLAMARMPAGMQATAGALRLLPGGSES